MHIRTLILTIFAPTLVLTTGCGSGHKDTRGPDTVRVAIQVVGDTSIHSIASYSGTVEAGTATTASFTIGGTIRSITVGVGDRVTKGQLLARVDDASLRSTYQGALAMEEEAQDVYRRLEILHNKKALADVKWVEIQSKLKQAKAMTAVARTALGDARLYAPISGIVSKKIAEVGSTAAPGLPVVEIMSQGRPKAVIAIPENQISGIAVGQTGTVTCQPLQGRTFRARISEKGVAADPLTRGYTVKLDILNPSDSLRPGMICDVALDNAPAAVAMVPNIVVPSSCVVLTDDNRNIVWLSRGGRASKQYVRIAEMTDTGIAIDSGLVAGDSVIVAGLQKVSQGTVVRPVK